MEKVISYGCRRRSYCRRESSSGWGGQIRTRTRGIRDWGPNSRTWLNWKQKQIRRRWRWGGRGRRRWGRGRGRIGVRIRGIGRRIIGIRIIIRGWVIRIRIKRRIIIRGSKGIAYQWK